MDLSGKGKNCTRKITSRDESTVSSAQESVGYHHLLLVLSIAVEILFLLFLCHVLITQVKSSEKKIYCRSIFRNKH